MNTKIIIMPKKKNQKLSDFGERLKALRKTAGFTQLELANEIGMTQRMIAYYERQSEHPPTKILPDIANALGVTTDELLGTKPIKRKPKAKNSRLQRRMQQIDQLPPKERRQILQLIDTFIDRERLKQKSAY